MKISAIKNYSTVNKTNNNSTKMNFVSFQAEPDKVEVSQDGQDNKKSKKTWIYVLGGLAVAAALIFGIKKFKASKAAEAADEIKPKGAPEIKPKNTPEIKPTEGNMTTENTAGTITTPGADIEPPAGSKTNLEEGAKINEKPSHSNWMLSEEEKAKITVNPSQDYKLRLRVDQEFVESNDINEVIEKIINSIYSGNLSVDRKVAREVLPTLIKNDEGLQIGGHYERFLGSINEENKDFAMTQVVPWLAKNYKKMGLTDWYYNNVFMGAVGPENIKCVKRLASVSKTLGLDNHENFFGVLRQIYNKGETFAFQEAIPTIIKNKEKLLTPKGDAVKDLIGMLAPVNIKRVFDEDLPMILANKEKLKLDENSGTYVVNILKAIDRNGKEFIFNEALPLVLENSEKLKINDAHGIQSLLTQITPYNKNKLLLIANNAEKLGIKERFDASIMFDKKSEQEILDLINTP